MGQPVRAECGQKLEKNDTAERLLVVIPVASLLDRTFLFGVVLLTVATPLALGSVLPNIYSIAEVAIFGLVIITLLKVWIARVDVTSLCDRGTVWIAAGLALFTGVPLLQLVPLPPRLEKIVSPATYDFYVKSLPGWPAQFPFSDVISQGQPAAVPWMPLSIAPLLTKDFLLKFTAYACLFLAIIFYPFGGGEKKKEAELHFYRVTVITIVAAAALTAAVGLVGAETWNGSVLWAFSPYGWAGISSPKLTRLSGPFVNPDRFGNYLVLALPIALSGLAFRSFIAPAGYEGAFRIFCAVTTAVLLGGIFGSLSRAAWIGTILGVAVLMWLATRYEDKSRPRESLGWKRRHQLTIYSSGLFALVVLAWVLVGPWERKQADLRLTETVFDEVSLPTRVAYWHDSLAMIRDFPLLGVGLGCWPELFSRYQRPPWLNQFIPAAHNDYVQLVTEVGVPGFLLIMGLGVGAAVKLYRARSRLSQLRLPVFGALLAGLATMAFHEVFDFNLQIPANAILFTVLLALAFRLAGSGSAAWTSRDRWPIRTAVTAVAAGATCVGLIAFALRQGGPPYPYNLRWAGSVPAARALLISHPANAKVHLWLADKLAYRLSTEQRLKELSSAVWVEPTSPFARDRYAEVLLKQHRYHLGLFEIEQSVFFAPAAQYHSYLAPQRVRELSGKESKAVESGLARAVARRFTGAADTLGSLYDQLGKFGEEGRLYEKAASTTPDQNQAYQYLIAGASAYSRAHDSTTAEMLLREAIRLEPEQVQAYQSLVSVLFASRHDLGPSKALVHEAIRNGADPYPLYIGLAQGAATAGQPATAESALVKAAELRPGDFQAAEQLGLVFMSENKLDEAIGWFRRSVEIQPRSAEAVFYLALAEERNYEYSDAERDYARAQGLESRNPTYRGALQALMRKVAANAVPAKKE